MCARRRDRFHDCVDNRRVTHRIHEIRPLTFVGRGHMVAFMPKVSLEDEVAKLPHRDRARIALKLIESLEPGRDEDVSELWLDEAERRLAAYDAGDMGVRDADEVFSEVEPQIK